MSSQHGPIPGLPPQPPPPPPPPQHVVGASGAPSPCSSSQQQRRLLHSHELANLHHQSAHQSTLHSFFNNNITQKSKQNLFWSLFLYFFETFYTFFKLLLSSPISVFTDPGTYFYAFIGYPILAVGLIVFTTVLTLTRGFGGLENVLRGLGVSGAGSGLSVANWMDPSIITGLKPDNSLDNRTISAISHSRPLLGGGIPTTLLDQSPSTAIDYDTSTTHRIFSIDLARSFLALASLVYERKDEEVSRAAAAAEQKNRTEAGDLLMCSEKVMSSKAEEWGFGFEAISDLATVSGPFASLFYGQNKPIVGVPEEEVGQAENPYIVLVFKGTTPFNLAEWLINFTFVRVPAAAMFGAGTVHRGWYQDLFSTSQDGPDGYGQIVQSIKAVARELRRDEEGKVQLWLTSHSLGSALSSLIYARFLHSPGDLGDDIDLRDCYAFATPGTGDGSFAEAFENSTSHPRGRPNILWRINHIHDPISFVPPGISGQEPHHATLSTSLLNYARLGAEVKLGGKKGVEVDLRSFRMRSEVVFVRDGKESKEMEGWNGGWRLLWPIYRHFPASYAYWLDTLPATKVCEGTEKMREVGSEEQGGVDGE